MRRRLASRARLTSLSPTSSEPEAAPSCFRPLVVTYGQEEDGLQLVPAIRSIIRIGKMSDDQVRVIVSRGFQPSVVGPRPDAPLFAYQETTLPVDFAISRDLVVTSSWTMSPEAKDFCIAVAEGMIAAGF